MYPLVKELSGMLRNMLSKGRKLKTVAKKTTKRYGLHGRRKFGNYNYGGYGGNYGRVLEGTGNSIRGNKYISKDFNIFHVI